MSDENTLVQQKTDLINTESFETALEQAAEARKDTLTLCKSRNKDNYSHFYDVMLVTRPDIQSILEMRKKNRSDADTKALKEFRKLTSQTYRQICSLIVPEEIEEGEPTRIQKMVQKIAPIVKMMQYIGNTEIDMEFSKFGIKLDYQKLSEQDAFSNKGVHDDIDNVFHQGKIIQEDIKHNSDLVKTDIFETSVDPDLRYDKSTNPTGIKSSDFCKLVEMKTKMMMATDEESKEKVDEQATHLAGEYEFANARNRIIQNKILAITSPEKQ